MKYSILLSIIIICTSCFETFSDLEESPFESTSNISILEVTGDLTKSYWGNEWETFIYLQADTNYLDMSQTNYIQVYKDNLLYKSTNIQNSGYAQFYDNAAYNTTHCYSFGIFTIDNGLSKQFVKDYCIEFK